MLLRLPRSLHYPITVTELLKQPNDNVERFAPLFSYSYQTTVTEGDGLGVDHQVRKSFPARYQSDVDGVLREWRIEKGAVITQSITIAEIEEPCDHNVQFGGMCASCGKDMTEASYVTEDVDAARAPINMVHDNIALVVSSDEAMRAEDEAKRRLLSAKKLSLVVDLDQTVIQATVDPTVAEWQKDPENPNYDAVKDVRAFQLNEDGPGGNGMWYYIKFRPGLESFLENVSLMYELHIYTMGTRSYAKNIAKLIDPDGKIFGSRILSRSENGSLNVKNLQRLFPVDTKMVVIIDDRADVWNWSPNLIKVNPYDFFIGIGDINSSFLPKRADPPPPLKTNPTSNPDSSKDLAEDAPTDRPEPKADGTDSDQSEESSSQASVKSNGSDVSALEQLVSMGGGDDPTVLKEQTDRQDEAITAQVADRPLLQKQKQLEAEEAASESASQEKDGTENQAPPSKSPSDSEKPRHHLLHDDDHDLHYLEQALRKIHSEYYSTHDRELKSLQGGRVAQLRAGQPSKKPLHANSDLALLPDIKILLPQVKRTVLAGLVIVFSGLVPLGVDVHQHDLAVTAKAYGARIEERISRKVTHLVAARPRTQKMKQAEMRGKPVVNTQWLTDSITRWRKMDESPYIVKYDGNDTSQRKNEDSDEILSDSEEDAPSNFDSEDEDSQGSKFRPSLTINTNDEEVSDTEGLLPTSVMDDKSPVGGTNEDWDAMKNELADFLGSDAEDSGSESLASGISSVESNKSNKSTKSTKSTLSVRGKKRQRPEPTPGDSESENDSPGNMKKRRGTALRQTIVAGDKDSGLPTPDITAGEEGGQEGKEGGDGDEEAEDGEDDDDNNGKEHDDDGWSEFEDDLEAEMERAANEGI